MDILDVIRQAIRVFCAEFVRHPYLCYTEHGQHALFYTRLYNLLPEEARYVVWQNQKICIIQKEYPTATILGKSRRQHWDTVVVDPNFPNRGRKVEGYDHLPLLASIEFGLNEAENHLKDDIERLEHVEANIKQGFIVHLYRLSNAKSKFSDRDWSSNSTRILIPEQVGDLTKGRSVEIYYGMADSTCEYRSGIWHVKGGKVTEME